MAPPSDPDSAAVLLAVRAAVRPLGAGPDAPAQLRKLQLSADPERPGRFRLELLGAGPGAVSGGGGPRAGAGSLSIWLALVAGSSSGERGPGPCCPSLAASREGSEGGVRRGVGPGQWPADVPRVPWVIAQCVLAGDPEPGLCPSSGQSGVALGVRLLHGPRPQPA